MVGNSRCNDTVIGKAVAALVLHAEQIAALDRFGSSY
jgi:hypothetical protein